MYGQLVAVLRIRIRGIRHFSGSGSVPVQKLAGSGESVSVSNETDPDPYRYKNWLDPGNPYPYQMKRIRIQQKILKIENNFTFYPNFNVYL